MKYVVFLILFVGCSASYNRKTIPITNLFLRIENEKDSIRLILKNKSNKNLLIFDPSAFTYPRIYNNGKSMKRNSKILSNICFSCIDKFKLKAKDSIVFKFGDNRFKDYYLENSQEYDIFFNYYPSQRNLFKEVGIKSNTVKFSPASL